MSITPEQLLQAIEAAVAAAAQQWQEAAAQMQQEIGHLRTQVQAPTNPRVRAWWTLGYSGNQSPSTVSQDGKTGVPSSAAMHLFGVTLGTNGENRPNPVLNATLSQTEGLVFHAALLHTGHVVQRDSPHASGERWRSGGPGSLESCRLTQRTDLVEAQRRYVAKSSWTSASKAR